MNIHGICPISLYRSSRPATMDLKESITQQTDVAMEITKQLLQTDFNYKNMVFSPLSIHIVLSLIASGTKGPTLDQFLSFLKSKSTHDLNSLATELVTSVLVDGSAACVLFANGVWVDKSLPFKPAFKHVVDTAYTAALKEVNFKANPEKVRSEVNAWAEKETNGLIKEALPPRSVNFLTRLIFANALYFKADWTDTFDPWCTRERDFYLLNGNSATVPFMTSKSCQLISAFDSFKVLKLLYRENFYNDRRFSMCWLLPDARDGLPALTQRVCSESGFLDRHLPSEHVLVGDFFIPKFKISSGFEASQVLKSLGLVLPFTRGPHGGYVTEMVDSPPGEDPYVSGIFQKSFIEVNEKGTVAAAITAAVLRGGGGGGELPEKKEDFVADHPFMFLIREESTGTVLFMGQVLDPLAG